MKENPPITPEEIQLLESCRSADDWSAACDLIKEARGGHAYPPDWWDKVKLSGLMDRILSRWESSSELRVTDLDGKLHVYDGNDLLNIIPGAIPNDVDGRDMRNDETIPF